MILHAAQILARKIRLKRLSHKRESSKCKSAKKPTRQKGRFMPTYTATLQRIKEYSNITHTDNALRKVTTEGSTIGRFILKDENGAELFKCYSLENAGESTDKERLDKRIMPREYRVKWSFTGTSQGLRVKGNFRADALGLSSAAFFEKYKDIVDSKHHRCLEWGFKNLGLLLWVESRPAFENRSIFIHNGNYPQDTKGCILLGYGADDRGIINDSSRCIEDFNNLILKLGAENIRLIVKEIEKA